MVTGVVKWALLTLPLVLALVSGDAIRSPNITNWGDWGRWDDCLYGTFVNGMRLKVETPLENPDQNDTEVDDDDNHQEVTRTVHDETAMNGVQLFCSSMGSRKTKQNISSSEGPWGTWGPSFVCPGFQKAIGFQLRVEGPLGHQGDNTATNNIRLICEGQPKKVVLEGNGMGWGEWTKPQFCPRYQFICGIRTQVAPDQRVGDNTALNRIDMDCCNPFTPLRGF